MAAIMHFADLELLRDRLLETVLHMHGQPPAMPLLMGGLLKLFGAHYPLAMEALFHLLGLGIGWTLLSVLRSLGARTSLALAAALVFTLLPGPLVYEHYWFFPLPVVFLLLVAARFLVAACRRQSALAWAGFFAAAALVTAFRNLFHLAWLGALLPGALLATPRGRRRAVLLAFLPALALGSAAYVKNAIVFGRFEASSWIGFGLARKTWHQHPMEVRRAWIAAGAMDPIAGVEVYGEVEDFARVVPRPPPSGIPVLDQDRKSSGWNNYHHAIYLEASRRMAAEALRLIRAYPEHYWANVRATVRMLFLPSTAWAPVRTPYTQAQPWCDAVDGALFHSFFIDGLCAWSLLAALVLLGGLIAAARLVFLRSRASVEDVLLAFIAGTLLYLYAVSVLLDTNETMRHRLNGDGLLWLAALVISARAARLIRREPRHAASSI